MGYYGGGKDEPGSIQAAYDKERQCAMKTCDCKHPSCCYGGVVGMVMCAQHKERQFEATSDELPPIEQTLAERGSRYGDFTDHAAISQGLQAYIRATPGWDRLTADKKQALTTICDKIARILNGDPEYTDNWHDIAGYAKLAEDRCNRKAKLIG